MDMSFRCFPISPPTLTSVESVPCASKTSSDDLDDCSCDGWNSARPMGMLKHVSDLHLFYSFLVQKPWPTKTCAVDVVHFLVWHSNFQNDPRSTWSSWCAGIMCTQSLECQWQCQTDAIITPLKSNIDIMDTKHGRISIELPFQSIFFEYSCQISRV